MAPEAVPKDGKEAAPKDGKRKKPKLKHDLSLMTMNFELNLRSAEDMEPTHCFEIHRFLKNRYTEMCLTAVIVFNLVVVIVEADALAEEDGVAPGWVSVCNSMFLVIFGLEIIMRLAIHHFKFFTDPWCVIDFFVVFPDIVLEIIGFLYGGLPSFTFLRILRLLRLGRAVRILSWFPELFALVKGLAFALRAIFWGTLLILLFLMIYAIIAVQFIHPLSREMQKNGIWDDVGCPSCSESFSSVPRAMLTFIQQTVAGDNWGATTVPIIVEYPFTALFFLAVLVSVTLAMMNLILAVIVDKAAEAKEDNLRIAAAKKELSKQAAKEVLLQICEEIDVDGSGTLTYEEIVAGFDTVEYFSDICKQMDISTDDMKVVCGMMDEDGSGDIDYDEFVNQLYKMKNDDSHTLLVFIKYYVGDIQRLVKDEMTILKQVFEDDLLKLSKKEDALLLKEDALLMNVNEVASELTHTQQQRRPNPSSEGKDFVGSEQIPQTAYPPKLALIDECMPELEEVVSCLCKKNNELTAKVAALLASPQRKVGELSGLLQEKGFSGSPISGALCDKQVMQRSLGMQLDMRLRDLGRPRKPKVNSCTEMINPKK